MVKPFRLVAPLGLYATLASAGIEFWAGTCNTGVAEESWDNRSACKRGDLCGGCSAAGYDGWGSQEFTSGNPCNDCNGPSIHYIFSGDKYVMVGDSGFIGICYRVDGENGVCNAWNYACSYVKQMICWTPGLEGGCRDNPSIPIPFLP
jgi:hypothetical protein